MRLFFAVAFAALCSAQNFKGVLIVPPSTNSGVQLIFSQQGSASIVTVAGKKVKGQGLVGITIVNHGNSDVTLDQGQVYAAAGLAGISFILPSIAVSTMSHARALSNPVLALDAVDFLGQLAGTAGLVKAVKMSNGWSIALAVGVPFLVSQLKSHLSSTDVQPDPVALLTSPIGVKAHSANTCVILARYHGDWLPKEISLP